MELHVTLTDEQVEFLSANSSRINENYFIPYWFRRIEGNRFEMFALGKLPPGMSKEIEEMREQVKRDTIFAQFDENAYFKKP